MSLHRRILLSIGSNGHHLSTPPLPSPSRQVPSHVIIAVASVAAASVFLAIIYYAVLRSRSRHCLPSTGNPTAVHDTASASFDSDHPIWHIQTIGLDDSAIESIGSYAYAHKGSDHTADCSVCLGELLDGETVRLLPKCSHVFHVQCINTWLRSHVSCPLCRVGVAVAPAAGSDVDVDGAPAENPQSGEESRAGVSVENSLEIPENSEAAAGVSRSISMDSSVPGGFLFKVDEEKEGNSSNCSKEDVIEKGQSESARGFLFSRLGRARSSSILPL